MILAKLFSPPGQNKPKIFNLIITIVSLYALFFIRFFILLKSLISPLYRAIFASRVPSILRTPTGRFKDIKTKDFAYESNFINLELGGGLSLPRIHYLDEGKNTNILNQDTILCLHGEPTWSFTYRKMIPGLANAGYRVVVPDLIGFGMSDKYTNSDDYNLNLHISTIHLLITTLNLSNVTLVVQDWGGMIGLNLVRMIPDTFSNLVILNTALPIGNVREDYEEGTSQKFGLVHSIMNITPFLIWRSAVELMQSSFPVYGFFRYVIGFSPEVSEAYSAPFPNDPGFKEGLIKFPMMVPIFRDDDGVSNFVDTRSFLKTWDKPTLIMFGDRDPICSHMKKLFVNLIPSSKIVDIPGAGHFLQETHGPRLAENIVKFKEGVF